MCALRGEDMLGMDLPWDEERQPILSTATRPQKVLQDVGRLTEMQDRVLTAFFFEPSIRTRLSRRQCIVLAGK